MTLQQMQAAIEQYQEIEEKASEIAEKYTRLRQPQGDFYVNRLDFECTDWSDPDNATYGVSYEISYYGDLDSGYLTLPLRWLLIEPDSRRIPKISP